MRRLSAVIAFVLGLTGAQGAELTRILVGFPPGQATDTVARLLAERLGPALGENIIIENRPGQGGSAALASLLQSPPDGHTMVLAPLASLVVNPHMYRAVTYRTLKDFAPVALVADLPLLLVVNPSLPVKTVPELIAYAKANPDKLTHPSSGNGTLSHLGMEVFKQRAGISILHVPYRGSVPAMVDLMGGIVNVAMDTVPVTEPFIRDGKMRLIASAYGKRVPGFPGYADGGGAGISGRRFFGLARHRRSRRDTERPGRSAQRGGQGHRAVARDHREVRHPGSDTARARTRRVRRISRRRGRALERGGEIVRREDRVVGRCARKTLGSLGQRRPLA
jgi:tripartite-type tricarboxylate transporter receptor subunit TctC